MRPKENNPDVANSESDSVSAAFSSDWHNLPPRALLRHVPEEEVPRLEDLHTRKSLQEHLDAPRKPPYSVIAVGDIMLGGRARSPVAEHGPDYPFAAVLPLLRRAPIVVGNLEGPFAEKARRQRRNFSYRVNPSLASSLTRANIHNLTLANNHLLDCGRAGVLETLEVLARAGVAPLGAGANEVEAHHPVIRQAGRWRIGLLGYYWNRRTAATSDKPGSAMDPPESLEKDIHALGERVDRVVVIFHWGVPYVREPAPEDRAKARLAIDFGADVVIGHHPHVIQPFEIYHGRPIFFSVGNFAFGSGNSRAEGLLVAIRFEESITTVVAYPLYVKNRDPRVNYQPKVLRGGRAEQILRRLATISGSSGALLQIDQGTGRLTLPYESRNSEAREVRIA
jgi:poly-gamma-glutamate capsule biosynthesis protein CapA/YwtB (metallophosphatase superfamily)